MKRVLQFIWLGVPLIAVAFFAWGVFVGQYKTFRFEVLRALKHVMWATPITTGTTFTDTRGRLVVGCPRSAPLIVAIGQSNAANAVPLVVSRTNVPAYNFYDGQCFVAEDPLLGTSGDLGSLWAPLAQNLAADGLPVVLIAGAVWGSAISEWLPGERGYWLRVAAQLVQARQAGLVPEIVIWLQGETDAAIATPKAIYQDSLARLIGLSRTESSGVDRPAWIIFQATLCGAQVHGAEDIRAAQTDLVDEAKGVYFGMDTDKLGAAYRYDGCHFNAVGRNLIVDKIANLIREKKLLTRRNALRAPSRLALCCEKLSIATSTSRQFP